MRRAFIGLAVMALTVLSFATPASAAAAQVEHFRFHGTFAEAFWSTSSAARSGTTFTDTSIVVSTSRQGSTLFADRFKGHLDADGNFTGGTDTVVQPPGAMEPGVTSGFSFTIDAPKLTAASVSGSGLPALKCTFDATGNETGCTETTVDVSAAWTGEGPVTRSVSNFHMKTAGFSMNSHSNGTSRNATATGTFNGLPLSAAALSFADLGTTHSGDIKRCVGTVC